MDYTNDQKQIYHFPNVFLQSSFLSNIKPKIVINKLKNSFHKLGKFSLIFFSVFLALRVYRGHVYSKLVDFQVYCLSYLHLYGEQLHLLKDNVLSFVQQLIDVLLHISVYYKKDALVGKSIHTLDYSKLYHLSNLYKNFYSYKLNIL